MDFRDQIRNIHADLIKRNEETLSLPPFPGITNISDEQRFEVGIGALLEIVVTALEMEDEDVGMANYFIGKVIINYDLLKLRLLVQHGG